MREFCDLNMVGLHHYFLQFVEVRGGNDLRFFKIILLIVGKRDLF